MKISRINYYNYNNNNNKINNSKITFTGCLSYENSLCNNLIKNNINILVHQSSFFRDLNMLNFVTNFIKNSKKDKLKIVSAGCSEGFELLSIKMLAENQAKNKKLSFLGFDPGIEAINKAKSFVYTIHKPDNKVMTSLEQDSFLAFPNIKNSLTPKNIKLFILFHKNFELNKTDIINIENLGPTTTAFFQLKEEKKGNIDFKLGDILNMNNFIEPNSVDVIFFKNALYHLTHLNNKEVINHSLLYNNLNQLIQQVDNAICNNGLFILGKLKSTHTPEVATILYKLLNQHNFKAVYHEENKPAIWQKF